MMNSTLGLLVEVDGGREVQMEGDAQSSVL